MAANSRASKNLIYNKMKPTAKMPKDVQLDYPGQPNLIRRDKGDFPKKNKNYA